MKNIFKKLIKSSFYSILIFMFSVTSAIAQDSFDNISNAREQALKTGGIDKTPFQKRFAELDKEVRYSEIYNQSVTPDQPDFPQKFKSFIMRIDKYNKKKWL